MDHKNIDKKLTFVSADRLLVSLVGIGLFLLTGFLFFDYLQPEWKSYQDEFRDIVEEKQGSARASSVPVGLQQIHVEALGRTDRCITCHLGVEWKGLGDVSGPYRAHPPEILRAHPVSRYGCTVCHGGQGFATTAGEAHGLIRDWEEPVLGAELGEFYVLNDRKALMQMNCNSCHRYERETPGAGYINQAKKLVNEKGCRACHVINGRGGTVGPDLTREGTKSAEQFNYERTKSFASAFSWHVAHLKNPRELVPETVMPNFNFSSNDAQSLAMLVMSWKQDRVPVEYIPGHNFRDIPSATEREREERMLTGPGAFFVKKNCFVCHSVSTLGIEAAAQIGPDLALAVQDVQARFSRTLEDFLSKPTGTMEVVLSTMITLSPEERKEAVEKLRLAYELKLKETIVRR